MKTHTQVVFPMMAIFAVALMLGTPSAFADTSEVTIVTGSVPLSVPGCEETNECYDPADAVVDVGGKVIMTNTDTTGIHTYTSGTVDGFAASPDGKFDSGILNANDSFEWSPDTVGEYPYYCMLHVWMQGTITVQEVAAAEEEDTHEEDIHDDGKMMDDSKMS
ncbi:MAG: cupredoxin domain-containing protein, partial [Nitrosopumilus sp.]